MRALAVNGAVAPGEQSCTGVMRHHARSPVVIRVEAAVEVVVVAVVPMVVDVDVDVPPSPPPTPAPRSPPGVEEKARCEAEDEPRGCAPDEAGAEAIGVGRADPHVSDPRVVPVAGAVDEAAARRDVGAVVAGCVADIYDVGRRVVDADEGH